MMTRLVTGGVLAVALLAACWPLGAQEVESPPPTLDERLEQLEKNVDRLSFALEAVGKKVDDLLWFERVGDVAEIDKVYIPTVPNPHETPRYGIANERHPFKIYCYVFIPRNLDRDRRHPMLVLPHGGVHGDFDTYYTHVVRELMAEGYVVIAPEYRGSTGYGKSYYEAIDYGGLEVEDVVAARDWAVERYDVRRRRAGRHPGLEPRRTDRPDVGLRPSREVPGGLRRRAGLRPRGAHGLQDRRATAICTRPTTTSARPPTRTSRSTAVARRPGTPTSCRRRC